MLLCSLFGGVDEIIAIMEEGLMQARELLDALLVAEKLKDTMDKLEAKQ